MNKQTSHQQCNHADIANCPICSPKQGAPKLTPEQVPVIVHERNEIEGTTCITKPCAECPWSRSSKPGVLGGSHPFKYIGQAYGPFLLPCHKSYLDASGGTKPGKEDQCAGAAIFRANVGMDKEMPSSLHSLPQDREAVFASAAEFCAHHMRTPVEMMDFLTRENIQCLTALALSEPGRASAQGKADK